ncbi:glycosyltransferase involved in cell wall biosynthesis [Nitrobacteraceae bacterium AZCC 2161]
MKIGFDISQTGSGKAGCGYFAHAIINAMLTIAPRHKYSLYPSFGDFYFDPAMWSQNAYLGKDVLYGPHHPTLASAREFWNQPELETTLGQPDIIHSNNFWTPLQIANTRLIYTLYDLGFAMDPEWTTEANRVGCFDGVFRSSIAADWVVAISEYSRANFLRVFPHFPPEYVRVVYPCSRFNDLLRLGEPPIITRQLGSNGFWLSVGTIEPRKNQRMLVKAYAQYLQSTERPMPLVLAGGKGWLMEDFEAQLEYLGISENVTMAGYVSDDELIWLYRNCYANLYPSRFEGFGLPVLEGMQFGAATICSNTTSMPEVAADSAILLAPDDRDAWTQNMLDLGANEELRYKLSLAALERAKQFNWERSAAALLGIYEEAIRSPKRQK